MSDQRNLNRRVLVQGGLAAGIAAAIGAGATRLVQAVAGGHGGTVVRVAGQSPTRTTMPIVEDKRASGGAMLALDTATAPPADGWYATYTVEAPTSGIWRLTATATVPVEQPHTADLGSYFNLRVNDGPRTPVPGSQPHWYESPPAWGDLSRLRLPDVVLRAGANTITFTVDEPTVLDGYTGYRFLLDEFTLTPAELALRSVHVGDPATNLGTYRGGEPLELRFRLNGPADVARTVTYTIVDYFGTEVDDGSVAIPAGADAAVVELTDKPPGNYRVDAALHGTATATGYFARLPEQTAATGPVDRFGVNAFSFALIPPARLPVFAAGMAEMGAGLVRDGSSWPASQPEPDGPYERGRFGQVVQEFQDRGLRVLEVVSPPPDWALTETSIPLADDLRDAYRFAAYLAGRGNDTVADALQLSNEPDVDDTVSTGDQHAAYVKAAALGIAAQAEPPSVVLPGIAVAGDFQELMLQNDVLRYADAWSFHGYPAPGDDPQFPSSAEDQRDLWRRHGATIPRWMTESGAMLPAVPGTDLTVEAQRTQARYLVLSTVESLAAGTDRQFWFCGPPCTDDGVSFAMLNRDFQPWPSFSAYAALIGLLGEADFVTWLAELLPDAAGFVFGDDERTVIVVYAPGSTSVTVPVPGDRAERYDIMGAHRGTIEASAAGTVRAPGDPDPYYLVCDVPPKTPAPAVDGAPGRRDRLSTAEHIVLNQRYAARNQAPNKADGDAEPPLGYRMDPETPMSVEVYNFADTARTVAVETRVFGGWSVEPRRHEAVAVPAMGRVAVPFTVFAGADVTPDVDYPLVVEATLDGERVPPSVSRIQLPNGDGSAQPIPLAPFIEPIEPVDGAEVTGPTVPLSAAVADALSGIDAASVRVEVDEERVDHDFDPDTGMLTASLQLPPGRHAVRLRAANTAHAPAMASVEVTVRD